MDALAYWKDALGVDGFRFDLAPVLGNTFTEGGFNFDKFDPNSVLNRAVRELPVRPAGGGAGVHLIAEPWGIGDGTYQLGGFPSGWAEWNGNFRDSFRTSQNKLGVATVLPAELATRFSARRTCFNPMAASRGTRSISLSRTTASRCVIFTPTTPSRTTSPILSALRTAAVTTTFRGTTAVVPPPSGKQRAPAWLF